MVPTSMNGMNKGFWVSLSMSEKVKCSSLEVTDSEQKRLLWGKYLRGRQNESRYKKINLFTRKKDYFPDIFIEHNKMLLTVAGNTNFSGHQHLQEEQSEKSLCWHIITVAFFGHQKSQ